MEPKDVLTDPEFHQKSEQAQILIMQRLDPQFSAMSPEGQVTALRQAKSKVSLNLTGERKEPVGEITQGQPAWKHKVSESARLALEGGGSILGGVVGGWTGSVPGAVTGGALGYAAGSEAADRVDEHLGLREPKPLAEQSVETLKKVGEGAAYEAGGMGLAATAGPIMRWSRNAYRQLTDGGLGVTEAARKRRVGNVLLNSRGLPEDEYYKNLERTTEIEREIGPDYQPTLAQASGDAGLARLERVDFSSSAQSGQRSLSDRAFNQKAVRDFSGRVIGKGGAEEVQAGLSAKQRQIKNLVEQAEENVARLESTVYGRQGPEQAGKTIRDTLSAKKARASLAAGELYDAVPNVELNAKPLVETVDSIRSEVSQWEKVPPVISEYLGRIKRLSTEVNDSGLLDASGNPLPPSVDIKDVRFRDLRKLRTDILRDLRTAGRASDEYAARRKDLLLKLKGGVEDTINQLENMDTNAGELFRDASRWYRENYVEIFKSGTVGKVLKEGDNITNAQLAYKFFQPGESAEVMRDFLSAVGDDAVAKTAMRDAIGHRLLYEAGLNPNSRQLKTLIERKYRKPLEEIGLFDEFKGLGKAREALEEAKEVQAVFEKSAAKQALDADPDNVVKVAFSGKGMNNPVRTATELLDMVGDNPAAQGGLKRAIVNHLIKRSELNSISFAAEEAGEKTGVGKLKAGFKAFDKVLRELYKDEPEKLKAVKVVRDAFESLEKNYQSPLAGSDTFEKYVAALTAAAGPIASKRYMVVNLIRAAGELVDRNLRTSIEALTVRALFDPDMANNLMYLAKGEMMPQTFYKAVESHLTSFGDEAVRSGIARIQPVVGGATALKNAVDTSRERE